MRTANEDSLASRSRDRVWAVADGMGGHVGGQYASRKIAAAIEIVPVTEDLQTSSEAVAHAIIDASDELYAEARAAGIGQMGSTVVSLILRDRQFAILWVGDSRCYIHRDGILYQLTRDHTQVQEMIDRGLLDEAGALTHPMRHVLARATGVQMEVKVDAVTGIAEIGDMFLLCSDGLHGVLSHDEITAMLTELGPDSAEKLVEACLERGAPDNVTVTVVGLYEATAVTVPDNQEAY